LLSVEWPLAPLASPAPRAGVEQVGPEAEGRAEWA